MTTKNYLRKKVILHEVAKREAESTEREILTHLESTYKPFEKTIQEKSIKFLEKMKYPIDPDCRNHFSIGEPNFIFSSKPNLKVCINYQNETWPRIGNPPRVGKEYLENLDEELRGFARTAGIDSLVVQALDNELILKSR